MKTLAPDPSPLDIPTSSQWAPHNITGQKPPLTAHSATGSHSMSQMSVAFVPAGGHPPTQDPVYSFLECCVLVAQSCWILCNPIDWSLTGSSAHGDSLGKNPGVGCRALLQGISLTQGSKLGLLHCRQILYCPSHQESPPFWRPPP